MCLAVPAKVIEINDSKAKVDYGGVTRTIDISLVNIKLDEYVIVHAGFAIEILDPEEALIREYNREHFGLRGMKERANSLGGTCQLHSKLDSGTSVQINIPLDALDRRG